MRFRILPVTLNLLIINIIMFVATMMNQYFMIGHFALSVPGTPGFEPWQPLTHMFMHGSFTHLLFNMYALFMFGNAVEGALGPKKYLLFYLLSGVGAFALHLLVTYLTVPAGALWIVRMLGASGAIYGVLIGFAMLYPNAILTLIFPPVSLKAKWMILIFACIEILVGVFYTSDGIAHFAHLGGMLTGFLLLLFWKKTGRVWERNKWF